MARDPATYRGARRNRCLRELKTTWGPKFYYAGHDYDYLVNLGRYKRATILRQEPSRYHPSAALKRAFPKVMERAARFAARIATRARSAGRGQ